MTAYASMTHTIHTIHSRGPLYPSFDGPIPIIWFGFESILISLFFLFFFFRF